MWCEATVMLSLSSQPVSLAMMGAGGPQESAGNVGER
jgi:hypothetical protein